MENLPSEFFTLAELKGFAGQVMVVVMLTQVVKSAVPTLTIYWIRLVAICTGVGLQVGLAAILGGGWASYLLAPINGALVAFSAMKAAEFLKGSKDAAPAAR